MQYHVSCSSPNWSQSGGHPKGVESPALDTRMVSAAALSSCQQRPCAILGLAASPRYEQQTEQEGKEAIYEPYSYFTQPHWLIRLLTPLTTKINALVPGPALSCPDLHSGNESYFTQDPLVKSAWFDLISLLQTRSD